LLGDIRLEKATLQPVACAASDATHHIHNREDKGNRNGNRSRNNNNGHHMGNGNRSSRPNRINNEKEQPIKSTKNPETKTDA
jgi:hypothetical protein